MRAMYENIDTKLDRPGKRMKHALTGLEIKLLVPTRNGWRAQVIGQGCDYIVNVDTDTINRKYRDVIED